MPLRAINRGLAGSRFGFRRDAHPTKEVKIWERIAAAYLEILQYLTLTAEEAKAVFVFFLVKAGGGEDPLPLPESLEPHRDLLTATFQSMHPVLEIAEESRTPSPTKPREATHRVRMSKTSMTESRRNSRSAWPTGPNGVPRKASDAAREREPQTA